MKVCFDNIVGNVALKNRISRDVCEGTVSHAYIIEGPEGIGRHTLAKSITAALSCIDSLCAVKAFKVLRSIGVCNKGVAGGCCRYIAVSIFV